MVKPPDKLLRQMRQRGWTSEDITRAIETGVSRPAINRETGACATRYIHPETGRSVVIDDTSGDVIHVGGDGFVY